MLDEKKPINSLFFWRMINCIYIRKSGNNKIRKIFILTCTIFNLEKYINIKKCSKVKAKKKTKVIISLNNNFLIIEFINLV